MSNLYYQLIFSSIERTMASYPSPLFKRHLIRTMMMINGLAENSIDATIAADLRHYVHQADRHDDLGVTEISLLDLHIAKTIIRKYVVMKGLVINRVKTFKDMGVISMLPIDCQLLILSLIV